MGLFPFMLFAGLIGAIMMVAKKVGKIVGWKPNNQKPKIKPNNQKKLSIFKILFRQWQFWALIIILFVMFIVAFANLDGVVNQQEAQGNQKVSEEITQQENKVTVQQYLALVVLVIISAILLGISMRLWSVFR